MFGKYDFEGAEAVRTPWNDQWSRDLEALKVFATRRWAVEEIEGDPTAMWKDREVQWKFLKLDMTQLRMTEQRAEVPPPGCIGGGKEEKDEEEGMWICKIRDKEGRECGCKFATKGGP